VRTSCSELGRTADSLFIWRNMPIVRWRAISSVCFGLMCSAPRERSFVPSPGFALTSNCESARTTDVARLVLETSATI